MKVIRRFGTMALLLGFSGWSPAEVVQLSESSVVSFARQDSAASARAADAALSADLSVATYGEKFETSAFAHANRTDTRQRGIFPFAPATGPVDSYELGVQKQLAYGLSSSVSAYTEQVSLTDDSVERATTAGVKWKITADLWRNFLGSLDRKQLAALSSQSDIAELQASIENKSFEVEVRKLYWSLVANEESRQISQKLHQIAQRQLKDSENRLRDSVADTAEVARYRAQVAARKAAVTSFEFQREQLFLQLKALLPGLEGKQLALAAYNLDSTVNQVLACSERIFSFREVPWDATPYDEIITKLEQQLGAKNAATDARDAADVQLFSELTYTGIGDSYAGSVEEFGTDGMPSYSVGLQVTVPIGGKKSAAETIERAANKAQFAAQNLDLKAKVFAHHEQMAPLISILQRAVRDQSRSAGLLERAIQETEKKFNQARVSVDALVTDQNALRDTELGQIKTKLAVIHAVLDYFKVFTDTNCELNRI